MDGSAPTDALGAAAARWFEELDDRGVFITDTQLVVRRWNHWLAAQTGQPSSAVVGRPLFDLYPGLVGRGVDAYYRDALAGEVRILSERFHKFLLPITLVEDVTERVIAERELRNQIAASEQARRLAEEASQLKDEFLATLSHEIRTPLNAVIGWTRILRTQPSVRSRAHALEVAFDDDVPAVSGDSERLHQVIRNLLANAVKFTESGGQIKFEIGRVGPNVRLSVRDTGQGISPDFLPYVFDRFRQADASASRRHGGLGLGLALVRQIVELHGGAVGADSRGVQQGTTFWVTLPSAQHLSNHTPAEAPAEPVTLKGVAVLIVEDETDSRELLVAILEEYGARVRAVGSADAALGILDGNGDGFVPDVLVSDVGMAGTDGFALVRELRSRPSERSRKLPAIAVTAYANPEDRVRALVAGYQNHVPKPVDANVLAAAIAKLVAG